METGEVEELTKDLFFASISDRKQAVRDYIKDHRLRFHTVEDFVSLLDYYHHLPSPAEEQSGIIIPSVRPLSASPAPAK